MEDYDIMTAKLTEIIIGPTPQAMVQYKGTHGFKWYKLIDQEPPALNPIPGSIHHYAGVGSESYCVADDKFYRKWASGKWSPTEA